MNAPSLEERMDNLERIVEPLRGLPDRVTALEVQVVQLRTEMRSEFSAIRRDMVTKDDLAKCATKDDLTRFATKDDLTRFATKDDLRAIEAQLSTRMLVLHEDLVERLKVIGEAQARSAKRPRKTP